MNPSTALATWLVDELVARGVRHVVLCPGSRNAPLSFALAAHPAVTLHSRVDERTAAFLALGIAKSSRAPACFHANCFRRSRMSPVPWSI